MWTGHRAREWVPLGGMWSKRKGLDPTVEVRRRRNGAGRDMTAELSTRVELGRRVGLDSMAEGGLNLRLWLRAVGR